MKLQAFLQSGVVEAGCDEAGRGCLAGPVVAAAVILPQKVDIPGLNDSKKLSAKARETIREQIVEQAIAWGVGVCSPEEIDRMNILKASFEAMHRAIRQLEKMPVSLLIDGNRFTPFESINHTCIVGGDAKFMSIAAASILAKTERDEWMEKAHEEWPVYDWKQNKGYPTKYHREAIRKHGTCPLHRKSFRLLPEQLKLVL